MRCIHPEISSGHVAPGAHDHASFQARIGATGGPDESLQGMGQDLSALLFIEQIGIVKGNLFERSARHTEIQDDPGVCAFPEATGGYYYARTQGSGDDPMIRLVRVMVVGQGVERRCEGRQPSR